MIKLIAHTIAQPVSFEVTVKPALNVQPDYNFSVDIYLLMDLSYSMRDDLANLQRLGAELGR